MRKVLLIAIFLPVIWASSLANEEVQRNWPQWRGPHLNGTSNTAHDLPVVWSETKNVKWRAKMPNMSAATPIVWEDTVFVTSAEEGFSEANQSRDKLLLFALNREDGSIRWRKEAGRGNRSYRKQNMSSPSPVTDGKHVWIMTGVGFLTCFDFDGAQIWQRNIEKDYGAFGVNHGYASTPLLYDGRLFIQVLHGMKTDDASYVFAADTKTGKTLWKVERPTDAPAESPDNYATPVLATVNGAMQLVISGGDYVTGHDLQTGKELWRMGGFNPNKDPYYRTIASSITIGDTVYTTSTRGKPFIAFRAGGKGTITSTNEIWKNDLGSDVPTPTTDGKRIYVVDDKGIVTCLDAKTGKVIWDRQRIASGTYSASPLLADGKIYATTEDGTTSVLAAGGEFKLLAENKLEGFTLASPSTAGNQLFIRTSDALYCLQKQ
jgi:outer membrane protein assembly factor BamB